MVLSLRLGQGINAMLLSKVFESFVGESPVTVMFRGMLENAWATEEVDLMFLRTAHKQYLRKILFSDLVDLMSLVVTCTKRSVGAAYQTLKKRIRAHVSDVYRKLNGIEPQVSAELVRHLANRLQATVEETGGALPARFPDYRMLILDGNHLAKTQHRLKELRTTRSGPLPGQALAVLDPRLKLIVDVFPCENGHAQERSLLGAVLERVQPRDLYIDDRNFCTSGFLFGLADRGAFFITRQHASTLRWEPVEGEEERYMGKNATGEVWEGPIRLTDPESGKQMIVRRVRVKLYRPTRNGDKEVVVLTNLPHIQDSLIVADAYLDRWTIENAFGELALAFNAEIDTLAYPPAALFAFCVALMCYNLLSVVKAALRAVHGADKVQNEVSTYYLTDEISSVWRGMMIAIPEPNWAEAFAGLKPKPLAELLVGLAKQVDLPRFQKHPRGPKKPAPNRTSGKRQKHVATAKILAQRKENKAQKAKPPPC
jgi:hypothetical protein